MSVETTPKVTNKRPILTIFFKEFREIFRDRRTITSALLGTVISPLMFALIGYFFNQEQKSQQTKVYEVGVIHPERSVSLKQSFMDLKNLHVTTISQNEAQEQIKTRKLHAAVMFPEKADENLKAGNSVELKILFDMGNETSQSAKSRIEANMEIVGQKILAERLNSKGLSSEFARPIKFSEILIDTGGSLGLLVLSRLLPYVLILSAFSGGIYAAFDQVAGEKERGTLETLLVSPASRMDIVLGKFLAVCGVCLVNSVLAIIGLVVPFVFRLQVFEWMARDGITINPLTIFVILLAFIPMAILFGAMLLAISTFARNQKEAQSYLGLLFPIILVPAMISMIIGADFPRGLAFVPILNVSVIIRQAISGSFDPYFIALAAIASILYAGTALYFAVRLFQKESVLIKA